MNFIVVKHPVRPEYADTWVSLVEEFTACYPGRTMQHLL